MSGASSLQIVGLAAGDMVYASDRAFASRHALPMVKVVIPVDGWVEIEDATGRSLKTRDPLVVAPQLPQAIRCEGMTVTAFLRPHGPAAMLRDQPAPIAVTRGSLAASWQAIARDFARAPETSGATEALLEDISRAAGALRTPRLDPRVQRALAQLAEIERTPSAVASDVGLSTSRMTHLFTAEVGVPLRRYLLWQRLVRGMTSVLTGAPVTEAAHEAGFSDHAHLTRTARQLLGRAPSEVARRSRIVQAR